MIQSKQPKPPVAPNENSNVPVLATFITIHVLFNSPDNKQPEFDDAGLVLGFETALKKSSSTAPIPLGSIAKVASVQIFTASTQSLAVVNCPNADEQINKKDDNIKPSFTRCIYV
jgi:hypothetical protein